eukprot:TRINITY_DN12791_c0_g2_i1.p1 TRINITY_DN12791_c0_g2~~TRINITY_DN12791_c0_g2_i1.p1  ORF type:complete len:299 (+),score=41.20 TRINITY_DN12791_c0_g2_i1:251-1147(+)
MREIGYFPGEALREAAKYAVLPTKELEIEVLTIAGVPLDLALGKRLGDVAAERGGLYSGGGGAAVLKDDTVKKDKKLASLTPSPSSLFQLALRKQSCKSAVLFTPELQVEVSCIAAGAPLAPVCELDAEDGGLRTSGVKDGGVRRRTADMLNSPSTSSLFQLSLRRQSSQSMLLRQSTAGNALESRDDPLAKSDGYEADNLDLHRLGLCKPCPFAAEGVCKAGENCKFCHVCRPDMQQLHEAGLCRPCIFFMKPAGCSSEDRCRFCHREHAARQLHKRHLRRSGHRKKGPPDASSPDV